MAILLLLVAGFLTRGVVLLTLPPTAFAFDTQAWGEVADVLAAKQNPYNLKPFLSWPPAWMQLVFLIDRLADAFNVSFNVLLRGCLIVADCVAFLLVVLLQRHLGLARSRNIVLFFGWSINPVPVLLVCQHGNFDVLVAISVLLCLLFMTFFATGKRPVHWLWASAALGVGVALKTVPLVLTGLLAGAARRLERSLSFLGLLLVLGPAAYGLSVIYVLGPEEVTRAVFAYRSFAGWFGIPGVLSLAGLGGLVPWYGRAFALGIASLIVWLAIFARRDLSGLAYLLWACVLLAAIPALGPGYGPQYIGWFWPLLLAGYPLLEQGPRRAVLAFAVIADLTYLVEYALLASHGAFALALWHSSSLDHVAKTLDTQRGQTILRLPLFAGYLWLLAALGKKAVELSRIKPVQETTTRKPLGLGEEL